MKKVLILAAAAVMLVLADARAQVIVNPNGTTGVVTGNVIVNSTGTTGIIAGNAVHYSDGTTGVVTGNVIVNSNGTHSIVTGGSLTDDDDTGATRSAFSSDGAQSAEPDDADGTYSADEWIPDGTGMSAGQRGIYLDGRRISVARAKDYSRQFPEAMKHFRRGQLVYGVALVAAVGGGALVGYQIGCTARRGMNAAVLVAGVMMCGGSIGLTCVTVGQYRKAAAAYNSARGLAWVPRREITLAVAPAPGGFGVSLTF